MTWLPPGANLIGGTGARLTDSELAPDHDR
jgi:hypothetical protein